MRRIECKGAPRDLGIEQGLAFAREIGDWCATQGLRPQRFRLPLLRRLAGGAVLGAGVGRETLRHYPHAVECATGIARASRTSLDALMEDVVATAYAAPGHPLTQPAAACAAPGVGAGRALDATQPWVARRTVPEVGFASVEVVLPWLPGGVVGVNAEGLAVAVAAPAAPPRHVGLRAAPAWLLVQECLQRFADLRGAVAWCLERPSAGCFHLLLADASGGVARVDVDGETRARAPGGHGLEVAGGTEGERAALRARLTDGEASAPLAGFAVARCADAALRVELDGEVVELSAR